MVDRSLERKMLPVVIGYCIHRFGCMPEDKTGTKDDLLNSCDLDAHGHHVGFRWRRVEGGYMKDYPNDITLRWPSEYEKILERGKCDTFLYGHTCEDGTVRGLIEVDCAKMRDLHRSGRLKVGHVITNDDGTKFRPVKFSTAFAERKVWDPQP